MREDWNETGRRRDPFVPTKFLNLVPEILVEWIAPELSQRLLDQNSKKSGLFSWFIFYLLHRSKLLKRHKNIKYQQNHPQGQTGELCRIFQLYSWISTIITCRGYETANRSLPQRDREINKRTKQNCLYLNKFAKYLGLQTNFFRG